MRPDRKLNAAVSQRGFAIVGAIFLLLLMAALAALMVSISTAGNAASTQDIQGSRAYQAARSGLEWGIFTAAPASCSTTTLPTLAGDLASFSVTVTCSRTQVTEGANTVNVYAITSTAKLGTGVGSANYIERQLQASVEK